MTSTAERPVTPGMQTQLTSFFQSLTPPARKVLIGVSGGADSVALLRLLHGSREPLSLQLTVAHYDHAMRSDSAADGDWVRRLCESLGLPAILARHTDFDGVSPLTSEASARAVRYDFLVDTARTQHCDAIAVAHTFEDQAETILHQIVRGTGLKGLCGMPAVRELLPGIRLLRPLLTVKREMLLRELHDLRQPFLTDPTNDESTYTRNRIRHTVLPMLRTELNPRVDEALVRLAGHAEQAQSALGQLAQEALQRALLDSQADCVRLRRDLLSDRPAGLLVECLRQLWQTQQWPMQSLNSQHLQTLVALIVTGEPKAVSLPGQITATYRSGVVELRGL